MICTTPERTCPVPCCAEVYRIYLNSTSAVSSTILARNLGTGKELFFETLAQAATIDGKNISRVNFAFSDFGNFLLSDSEFEFQVVRSAGNGIEPVEIYSGMTGVTNIYSDSITVKFDSYFDESENKTTPIDPIVFKSVNAD